jgi:hypothetical protein
MQFWSWLLTAVGVFGLYLAGRRNRLGWAVGLGAQALWMAYALTTEQYGFIASALAYGVVYAKNLRKWRAEDSEKSSNVRLEVWPLDRVLSEVRCGSRDWSWAEEWADLDRRHAQTGYLDALERRIRENGITMPVLIGSDGRLWDGHHRLRIAVRLGLAYVPVEIAGDEAGRGVGVFAQRDIARAERDQFLSRARLAEGTLTLVRQRHLEECLVQGRTDLPYSCGMCDALRDTTPEALKSVDETEK